MFSPVALFAFYVVPLLFQVCSGNWHWPGDVQLAGEGLWAAGQLAACGPGAHCHRPGTEPLSQQKLGVLMNLLLT